MIVLILYNYVSMNFQSQNLSDCLALTAQSTLHKICQNTAFH